MAEVDDIIDQPSESQKRIIELNRKANEANEAKSAAEAATLEAKKATEEAQKERDFYANFSDTVATNPAAKDHKDEILSKVKSGYSVEDATYAVLGKAGKLGTQPIVDSSPVAGGSAAISPQGGGNKSASDMTQDERRSALMEAERRGDIAIG